MSSLVPLLVRTFGRTGSTLLMQILGTNENVFFERQYPFEHRYLSYAYQMARIVNLPSDANGQWDNNNVFQGKDPFVGHLPYQVTSDLNKEKLSESLFESIWETFSKNMLEVKGIKDSERRYYAEKIPHGIADIATELLGARNIYLLRDPRDELVSIRSFNQKRGFNGFGWQENDTDKTFALRMCKRRKQFMQDILHSPTQYNRINIRYEDLIMNGEAEVSRLSEWVGVKFNLKSAIKNKKIKNNHMTAKNYTSSVERWRNELDDEVKEIFRDKLGDELAELGYAA